ncbi:hypothetical protein BGZ94_002424 [Podila epigama]|nr:hypothetical protein BGZ94_002424 [Podila epigama]
MDGDCGDCGDCGDLDCCVDSGDCCCFYTSSSCCCDTTPAETMATPHGNSPPPAAAGAVSRAPDVVPAMVSQPSSNSTPVDTIIRIAPEPTTMDVYPVFYSSYGEIPNKRENTIKIKTHKKKDGSICSARIFFSILMTIGIIAALGVTAWLTMQIPFGGNCGNTHRSLMGALIAIVLMGMCLPLYYRYLQKDLIKKEIKRQKRLAAEGDVEKGLINSEEPGFFYYYDTNAKTEKQKQKLKKKSVLSTKRFGVALDITGLFLIIIVAMGYYFLWSPENRCTDPKVWVVKAWFFVLLAVAVAVLMLMVGIVFRARKERKILKLAQEHAQPGSHQ